MLKPCPRPHLESKPAAKALDTQESNSSKAKAAVPVEVLQSLDGRETHPNWNSCKSKSAIDLLDFKHGLKQWRLHWGNDGNTVKYGKCILMDMSWLQNTLAQ